MGSCSYALCRAEAVPNTGIEVNKTPKFGLVADRTMSQPPSVKPVRLELPSREMSYQPYLYHVLHNAISLLILTPIQLSKAFRSCKPIDLISVVVVTCFLCSLLDAPWNIL